jgi:hypothetical protein
MISKQGKNPSVSRIERVLWLMTYKYSLSQIPLFFLLQLSSVWDNNGWGDTKKCFSRWGAVDFFFEKSKGGSNRTTMLIPV